MNVESHVKVAVRCRPAVGPLETLVGPYQCLSCNSEQKQIELDEKIFNYDYVFDSTATQSDIYEGAVTKLTKKFLSGSNAAIIAYGQTGSGKTHTMGTNDGEKDVGIIPRTLRQIFESTNTETIDGTTVLVRVSFLEVYKEEVYDLLKEERPKISLPEDSHSIKSSSLTEVLVRSYEEAMVRLSDGVGIRTTGATAMNTFSSRSHTIFSVILETNGAKETKRCRMMLVDLAGSEAVKKTKTVGDRFKEGININRGLLALGTVIHALCRDKGNGYIPYRDSTLTKLLKNCLLGNCETLMIVCISPLEESVQQTMISLRFAEHALAVKVKPNVHSRLTDSFSGRKKTSNSCGPLRTRVPLSTVRQQRPYPVSTPKQSLDLPIPVFNLDCSPAPCFSKDESQFKKPKTPEQISSISSDLFSPFARKICSTIETSIDRVADRLILGSRNIINTPVRESIVEAVVHRISITHRSFVSNPDDSQNLTVSGNFADITPKNVRIPPQSCFTAVDRTMIEAKENISDNTMLTSTTNKSLNLRRSPRLSTTTSFNVSKSRDVPLNVDQSILMSSSNQVDHTVDILNVLNKGSVRELQRLPCVGPKSAVILHNWRITNGPLLSMNDIRSISGLNRSFYERFVEANMCVSASDRSMVSSVF